jgi:hypothetical protein
MYFEVKSKPHNSRLAVAGIFTVKFRVYVSQEILSLIEKSRLQFTTSPSGKPLSSF